MLVAPATFQIRMPFPGGAGGPSPLTLPLAFSYLQLGSYRIMLDTTIPRVVLMETPDYRLDVCRTHSAAPGSQL